jgi:hypothetical protein
MLQIWLSLKVTAQEHGRHMAVRMAGRTPAHLSMAWPCMCVQAENKFKCPCHGSQYNNEGKVIRGPAPLVCGGKLALRWQPAGEWGGCGSAVRRCNQAQTAEPQRALE